VPQPPTSRESRLKQISEAVGLLAGVVALVYLLGALVLALRLQTHDLPTLAVLSNLPRELVISVGLTYAVVPWLLATAAVAIFWFLREKTPAAPKSKRPVRGREIARAVVLMVPAVLLAKLALHQLKGPFTWWDALVLGVALIAVTLLANVLWRLLSSRYAETWTRPAAIALAAALTGLVAVPVFVEIGARSPLGDAQLCGEGPTHLRGWLLGEAGDRVYIGENVDPHRIVSAPRTGELYVGPDATEDLLCRGERVIKPTADQLVDAAFRANACARCMGRAAGIQVSGKEPWFASALIRGRRDGELARRELLLFRHADAGWRVVSTIPRVKVECGSSRTARACPPRCSTRIFVFVSPTGGSNDFIKAHRGPFALPRCKSVLRKLNAGSRRPGGRRQQQPTTSPRRLANSRCSRGPSFPFRTLATAALEALDLSRTGGEHSRQGAGVSRR
jgi:hypothetical protein